MNNNYIVNHPIQPGERLSRCTLGIGSNVAGLVKGKMYHVWDRDKHSQVWVRVKCKMCGIG